MKNISLENKLEIVRLYNTHHQVKTIASQYNIPVTKLRYWLKNQPEIKWRGKNTLAINENYFDEVNTPDKAYILGFISADGSISEHPASLSIELQYRDKAILNDIKKEFNYRGNIYDSYHNKIKYARLRISNQNFVKKLISQGISPRKTYGFSMPPCINKNNFRHFLRGFFDGDGCIYLNPNKGKSRGPRYMITLVCEKTFAYQLHSKILEFLGVNFRIVDDNQSTVVKNLIIESGEEIEKFLTILYENSNLKLNRKYKMFLKLKKLRMERNNFMRRRLTSDQFRDIRKLLPFISTNKISKQFGVSRSLISGIKHKTKYLDVI